MQKLEKIQTLSNGSRYAGSEKRCPQHIQDTYGIKVKSVNLPVKKGKYLLKELWWQSETVMKYYTVVRTKTGATITIRGSLFGRYEGKEVITVKPARNSMGFVITSMRYYKGR